jgi:hypothetical protein
MGQQPTLKGFQLYAALVRAGIIRAGRPIVVHPSK